MTDYPLNPGKPIGVSLHGISRGVNLAGLPEVERVQKILAGLGIMTYTKPESGYPIPLPPAASDGPVHLPIPH